MTKATWFQATVHMTRTESGFRSPIQMCSTIQMEWETNTVLLASTPSASFLTSPIQVPLSLSDLLSVLLSNFHYFRWILCCNRYLWSSWWIQWYSIPTIHWWTVQPENYEWCRHLGHFQNWPIKNWGLWNQHWLSKTEIKLSYLATTCCSFSIQLAIEPCTPCTQH